MANRNPMRLLLVGLTCLVAAVALAEITTDIPPIDGSCESLSGVYSRALFWRTSDRRMVACNQATKRFEVQPRDTELPFEPIYEADAPDCNMENEGMVRIFKADVGTNAGRIAFCFGRKDGSGADWIGHEELHGLDQAPPDEEE